MKAFVAGIIIGIFLVAFGVFSYFVTGRAPAAVDDKPLPFEKKKLLLGTWQRVVLVELDGPRERELALSISAEQ